MSNGNLWTIIFCCSILSSIAVNFASSSKQKRQLFREQVLPARGGKIPDSAFNTERLLLNRLNQQGISVPDGILLDQRRQEKHPFPKQNLPNSLKVILTDEGRFIAPPGRYEYEKSPSIDTTYVIRVPVKIIQTGSPESQKYTPIQTVQKYKIDVGKFVLPIWYNEISNNKNNSDEDIDPSQVLAEFSTFLQKIHNYDRK